MRRMATYSNIFEVTSVNNSQYCWSNPRLFFASSWYAGNTLVASHPHMWVTPHLCQSNFQSLVFFFIIHSQFGNVISLKRNWISNFEVVNAEQNRTAIHPERHAHNIKQEDCPASIINRTFAYKITIITSLYITRLKKVKSLKTVY